jgi:4-amino-4-deoxy-L-arabinose transferase-like glycosyltransferase
LAAALVFISALPGLLALPPLDRDESRFAQASAQMLETGDFINIRYQSDPRDKKPVGIHWLQAASVRLLSSVEQRQIWTYRIPSLLGAMIAAAACAWGAAAFFGSRAGFFAGAVLGGSVILSSEAFIAKTDAVLCGAVTLSMAALARLYGVEKGAMPTEIRAGVGVKALFWIGQAVAILDKGPIGPMVAALALLTLWIADREARWAKSLGWIWGPVLVALIVGPWAVAITVTTDGAFWSRAVGGDIAPKLLTGKETHAGPPGFYAAILPILIFPATFLLPAALIEGWRKRRSPGVRFAIAWLLPSWIVFELAPTKLVHYTLPTYGALAWLAAAALVDPSKPAFGTRARWIGGGLSVSAGLMFATTAGFAALRYGEGSEPWGVAIWAVLVMLLALSTGLIGAWAMLKNRPGPGLLAGLVFGTLTHMTLTGGLAPDLASLWTSSRVADHLSKDHLDPRNGVTTGPVAVVGYAEPSLVFALGTGTELDNAVDGADSVSDGQPAIVEQGQDRAFRAALAAEHVTAAPVDHVKGFDYSIGRPVDLTIWRSLAPAEEELPVSLHTP